MRAFTPEAHVARSIARSQAGAGPDHGSALIAIVLVTAILALLGMAYLAMAGAENALAVNERDAALALYAAEAGARLVVSWFDDPTSTGYLVPSAEEVDRAQRLVDADGDPRTPPLAAVAGDSSRPIYKDPAMTTGSILDRPYRPAAWDAFLGIETGADPLRPDLGPDIAVTAAHLGRINEALFVGPADSGLAPRITGIEIYAPPIVATRAGPMRPGIATIKVVAGVFVPAGSADERQVARRVVKAVIGPLPIPQALGPLASCADLALGEGPRPAWGVVRAVGDAVLPSDLDGRAPTGLPYDRDDPGSYIRGERTLAAWGERHTGEAIEDPWFRLISSGRLVGAAPGAGPQPWPFRWPGTVDTDHSNLFQSIPSECPAFDYDLWKSIVRGGGRFAHYFAYDGGAFRQDGSGVGVTFEAATAGRSGLFFFDTVDGRPPGTAPGDDPASNLTPAIHVSGDGWGAEGFFYINAKSVEITSRGDVMRTLIPPGEPGDASGFVNLGYPGTPEGVYEVAQESPRFKTFQDPDTGDWWCTDASRCDGTARLPAAAPVRDRHGLPFRAAAALNGILYTSGAFILGGESLHFGSIVARQGVIDGGGRPSIHFDEGMITEEWPRRGLRIPRVVVRSWRVGPWEPGR